MDFRDAKKQILKNPKVRFWYCLHTVTDKIKYWVFLATGKEL